MENAEVNGTCVESVSKETYVFVEVMCKSVSHVKTMYSPQLIMLTKYVILLRFILKFFGWIR